MFGNLEKYSANSDYLQVKLLRENEKIFNEAQRGKLLPAGTKNSRRKSGGNLFYLS